MQLKQKVKNLYTKIKQQPLWISIPSVVVFLGLVVYFINYIPEKAVEFSYSEKNTCIQNFIALPSLSRPSGNTNKYDIKNENILKIGNFELLSTKTCFSAKSSPKVGESRLRVSFLGSVFFSKTFKLSVSNPPQAKLGISDKLVPTLKPLTFTLSSPDSVFDYHLKVENKTASCSVKNSEISCNITSLNLLQDKNYNIELVRTFDGKKIATLVDEDIKTLKATNIIGSSPSQGQVIYDKPKVFTFDFDKEVIKADIVLYKLESDRRTIVDAEVGIIGKRATIKVKEDLTRGLSYEFTIDQLEAKDGSTLPGPYKLGFVASGGPTVNNINIGAGGVDANARVIITFDQAVSAGQDLSKFASLTGGSASISRTDNQIIFQLNNLPNCGEFSIKINQGLISRYDIVSKNGWSYTSRISCRRATSVIGYSVKGRPIIAYYYGGGPATILFTGGIHGSERSGSYIMRDWVSYLDSYAYKIPAGRQVVIVPDVNPDGLAVSSRYNANNVNLDRNFPAANWKSDIDTSSGLVVGGGGASPLSEPETRALASLTTSLRPRLEVSFHAQGSLIGANQVGDSVNIGNIYGSSVGYRSMIGQAEETMGYSITGEYEDWAGEQSIPAILIELPSASGRYFSAHQSVLWKMVNI